MNAEQQHSTDLGAYQLYVSGLAAKADGKVILNRTQGHAAVIIAEILRHSSDRVCILTGSLNPAVYGSGDVVSASHQFLARNGAAKIDILSEQPIGEDHPLLASLTSLGLRDRVGLWALPPNLHRPFHFAIGDGRHFRFEPAKDVLEALVKFGDTHDGGVLQSIFDSTMKTIREVAEPAAHNEALCA